MTRTNVWKFVFISLLMSAAIALASDDPPRKPSEEELPDDSGAFSEESWDMESFYFSCEPLSTTEELSPLVPKAEIVVEACRCFKESDDLKKWLVDSAEEAIRRHKELTFSSDPQHKEVTFSSDYELPDSTFYSRPLEHGERELMTLYCYSSEQVVEYWKSLTPRLGQARPSPQDPERP